MENLKFPEIFDLQQAGQQAQNNFRISFLSFTRIIFLVLRYEHNVMLCEDHTVDFYNTNMQGNILVQFKTGNTTGSKMLQCEINISGKLHFNLLYLEDRGEHVTPRYSWETMHEEPLNKRYTAEDFWQFPEEFAEYLPQIAEVLKK